MPLSSSPLASPWKRRQISATSATIAFGSLNIGDEDIFNGILDRRNRGLTQSLVEQMADLGSSKVAAPVTVCCGQVNQCLYSNRIGLQCRQGQQPAELGNRRSGIICPETPRSAV
jgi:hypothetical protein